jgi:hypothetical protein
MRRHLLVSMRVLFDVLFFFSTSQVLVFGLDDSNVMFCSCFSPDMTLVFDFVSCSMSCPSFFYSLPHAALNLR